VSERSVVTIKYLWLAQLRLTCTPAECTPSVSQPRTVIPNERAKSVKKEKERKKEAGEGKEEKKGGGTGHARVK
jgi:hypothetical protein